MQKSTLYDAFTRALVDIAEDTTSDLRKVLSFPTILCPCQLRTVMGHVCSQSSLPHPKGVDANRASLTDVLVVNMACGMGNSRDDINAPEEPSQRFTGCDFLSAFGKPNVD